MAAALVNTLQDFSLFTSWTCSRLEVQISEVPLGDNTPPPWRGGDLSWTHPIDALLIP